MTMALLRTAVAAGVVLATAPASALIWNLSALLDGNQEVPPTGSLGTGAASITYDDVTNTILTFTLHVDGIAALTPTDIIGAHIHKAPFGMNGPVIFNLGAFGTWTGSNGSFTYNYSGGGTIAAVDEAAFLSQGTYINVHTPQHPGGEIRGQVVPEPATLVMVGLALAALTARRRRA